MQMRNVENRAKTMPTTNTCKTQKRPFTDGLQFEGIFFMRICKILLCQQCGAIHVFDVLACSVLPSIPKMNEMKSQCLIKTHQWQSKQIEQFRTFANAMIV